MDLTYLLSIVYSRNEANKPKHIISNFFSYLERKYAPFSRNMNGYTRRPIKDVGKVIYL